MMTEPVKTEIQPPISPQNMPSLIKSEADVSHPATDSPLSEDALASLLKALIALNPTAKTNLIQSILSSGSGDGNPGNHETVPRTGSPPNVTVSSPLVTQTYVTMATTNPTKLLPAMSIPSSIMVPTSIVSQIPTTVLPQIQTCQTFTPTSITFTPASLPQISTSLNLPTSLPQLIPVTSDFSSLVAAPASTSVMNSGNHTQLTSHHLAASQLNSGHVTSHVNLGHMSVVSALLRNSGSTLTTNSSQQLKTPPIDRSSTDSEELNMQARKLADQLAAVRSRLLLSSIETAGGVNSQYLAQLVKLEQLIHVLQEAVAQRQVHAAQPSIILGGARRGADDVNVFVQPGYDGLGNKRKGSPKSVQKSGKKIKHSGGSHGIQLWQFILELLGDSEHSPVLAWTGNGLEFRIINSVELARLWGLRKRNPIMNFDKLSRALRYYYEKNIIKHNPMHRLVYSFCNNPDDMVYNALLNRALATCPIDAEMAKQQVGESPYKWQDNLSKVPSSFKVTLQAVRNKMNGMVEEEKFPLSVNNI